MSKSNKAFAVSIQILIFSLLLKERVERAEVTKYDLAASEKLAIAKSVWVDESLHMLQSMFVTVVATGLRMVQWYSARFDTEF